MDQWLIQNLTPTLLLLAVGTIASIVLSVVNLWRSVSQERMTYRPVFSVSPRSIEYDSEPPGGPHLKASSLQLLNTGMGTASEVRWEVRVHESVFNWFPKYTARKFQRVEHVKVGDPILVDLGSALEASKQDAHGHSTFTIIREFEVLIRYKSALDVGYLTYLSIGKLGRINRQICGSDDTWRLRMDLKAGSQCRYWLQRVPLWLRVFRASRLTQKG